MQVNRCPAYGTSAMNAELGVQLPPPFGERLEAHNAPLYHFGKTLEIAGSKTTTFVAVDTRAAYFPRARVPKSER